jgi:hypothetical protein
MTSLFGRNPLITALIGVTLIVIGLAGHAPLMPWIGGGLVVVGGVRAAIGSHNRDSAGGGSAGRHPR